VDDAGASFQCILQDLDRDGDCDLYVSNDKGTPTLPNRYFRNEGGVFVSEPTNGACIAIDSMGVFAGDVDMNGVVDIYCTNVGCGHALLLSVDAQSYAESAVQAGVAGAATGWGTVIFDPDNDGDQDIFAASMGEEPDYMFLNDSGFPFADRSMSIGLGDGLDTYCIAVSDVDRDGDLDLLTQPHLATLDLHMNTAPAANNAIRLKILGRGANTHAVGAIADIRFGKHTVLREVLAGSCYKSQSSYILHAGIGTATVADEIIVRWPRVGSHRPERVLVNYPAGVEWPIAPPELLGDANRDGNWNGVDTLWCEACVDGAFVSSCAVFDFDGDADVDAADRAAFRARLVDRDRDGTVGAADLALILASWGTAGHDITGDGVVGAADLALLLDAW
ncbi:MAG: CRTAC1 family protein, partial [bacterium]